MTPDAIASWVDRLPPGWQPYARLARLDRPIGSWLLFWPCVWGVVLAGGRWWLMPLFGLGTIAMRGAGCVYNDIVDRDLDAGVARTRGRPIPSGAVSVGAARRWMVVLALLGFCVWLALGPAAKLVAIASLAIVAAYPFMKRITSWPQAWLGLAFNWGALVSWAQVRGTLEWPALALWGAGIAWTLGYDTIYALQDIADDAVVGVKSSARALGAGVRAGVAGFFVVCVVLLGVALWMRAHDSAALLALVPVAGHFAWQVARLRRGDPGVALKLFRANRDAGALVALACLVVGLSAL